MSGTHPLSTEKRRIIKQFSGKSDSTAAIQMANTLIPYAGLWLLAYASLSVSLWLTALCGVLMCLFLLRIFVLMHECGHNSLFATARYNKQAGFLLGVLCGMPQHIWAKNHAFHHATNGNWDQYRGPLATLSLEEYQALTEKQQWIYRNTRHIAFAPVGGFLYLLVNPRLNWLKGNLAMARELIRRKRQQPSVPLRTLVSEHESRYWRDSREYRHMSGNNLVLLSLWALMAWAMGPLFFFVFYTLTLSLSGAGGIILFTVQHNFEDSLASEEADWDYHRAAVEGTSFLVLPAWLNWFTADIAYHHIHHLSASIPNYHQAEAHRTYHHLFEDVPRLTLWQIPASLKNNLWDKEQRRITSLQRWNGSGNVTATEQSGR
ncbi:MAG: fatty acid desaturase [Oleiphilaceae bacterium]|nr:fatty acid desaturase [Oleiphilaceae bacterium]